MSIAFELPKETDVAPVRMIGPDDKAPLRCQEPGCTNAVTKPARGRTPKFCDEHKPASKAGTRSSGSWPKANETEISLNRIIGGIGAGLSLFNEVDGSVIATGGPSVVHELVELAKSDKTLRKYLEWIAAPGKYGPLTMALMGVIFPIAMNHGLVPKIFVHMPTDGKE